jgi:hypothetical protein
MALVAGCGSSSANSGESARTELDKGITALGHGTALTMRFSLPVSANALRIATQGQAKARAFALATGSSLTISESSPNGQPLDQLSATNPANVDISLVLAGKGVLELRVVHATLYAKANIGNIESLVGPRARARLTFVMSRIPPTLTFARAALAGQWISLSLAQARSLTSRLPGFSTPGPAALKNLGKQIRAVLDRDVSVRRAGSAAVGDHLVLTGNIRQVGTDILAVVRQAIPSLNTVFSRLSTSRIPARTVTVDAYVSSNVLTRISLNLAQFAPASIQARLSGQPVPLQLDFSQSAPALGAPAGAVPVNLSQLFPFLLGGLSSGSGTAPAFGG